MGDKLIIWSIDDDPFSQYINKKVISNYSENIDIILFSNAESALTQLELEPTNIPNLILLDWYLPTLSGHNFLIKLNELGILSDLKIIIITSTNEMDDIKIINSFNLRYIPKPLQIEYIEEVLGKKECFNSVKNMLKFLSKS